MLDKNLIKKNFKKSLKTYNENALVQKDMAKSLISNLKAKKYNKILEIGSYTGILTELAINSIEFKSYLAVDMVDSFDYIKKLSPKISFKKIKIEDFNTTEKFDLIASNAALQWVEGFRDVILKLKSMLNKDGQMLISIFGIENLKEIKSTFNAGLEYYSVNEIEKILPNAKIYSDIKKIKFKSPIDVLKHFKYTGINSVLDKKLSYKEIKKRLNIINNEYNNTITYNPLYIIN